jgi:hypothetical protein
VQIDLVRAAQQGDHEAFEVLATGAGDRLFGMPGWCSVTWIRRRTPSRKRSSGHGGSRRRCATRPGSTPGSIDS